MVFLTRLKGVNTILVLAIVVCFSFSLVGFFCLALIIANSKINLCLVAVIGLLAHMT